MKTILPLSLLVGPLRTDSQPLVIYHGHNCPDGFSAALATWLFYEGRAEFLGPDHGDIKTVENLPPLHDRAVYILDFSFPADILCAIENRASNVSPKR